jgi:hypothetical protein
MTVDRCFWYSKEALLNASFYTSARKLKIMNQDRLFMNKLIDGELVCFEMDFSLQFIKEKGAEFCINYAREAFERKIKLGEIK